MYWITIQPLTLQINEIIMTKQDKLTFDPNIQI